MTSDIKKCIRSLTRGRARLRHPCLCGLSAGDRTNFESMIMSAPGVLSASINPRIGSLLVAWDETETTPEALLEAAEFFFSMTDFGSRNEAEEKADDGKFCGGAVKKLESTGFFGLLDLIAPVIAADQARCGSPRTRRVAQNRLMLLSYALSIGTLGMQSKTAHWVIGTLFTAFLGLHLYQHKRVL